MDNRRHHVILLSNWSVCERRPQTKFLKHISPISERMAEQMLFAVRVCFNNSVAVQLPVCNEMYYYQIHEAFCANVGTPCTLYRHYDFMINFRDAYIYIYSNWNVVYILHCMQWLSLSIKLANELIAVRYIDLTFYDGELGLEVFNWTKAIMQLF